MVSELSDAHPDRQIQATIEVEGPLRCDPGRIQQLASNLLANALTHGLAGKPVRFQAATVGDDLVIEVWNDGDPIPAERLDKVFAPFWRPTAAREGLGLGLYICAQIVKSHGGSLTARVQRDLRDGRLRAAAYLDYRAVAALSLEARDKLSRVRPRTLGAAGRVPGITPADLAVLSVVLHRRPETRTPVAAG